MSRIEPRRDPLEAKGRGPAAAAIDYELILGSIGEGVSCLDPQGRITYVNPRAVQILGWTSEELLGHDQHSLVHHTRADRTPHPVSECPILGALRDGQVHRLAGDVFWRKDGTALAVDYISTPILTNGAVVGMVVAFRDASDREQGARQLAVEQSARSERDRLFEELQRVFMQTPAAVCITRGPDHIIESANLLYQELVGDPNPVGKSKRDTLPESSHSVADALDRVYATGEPYAGHEVRRVAQSGTGLPEERFLNFIYQPLRDADGIVYGIMSHFVDVTDLVRSRRLVEEHADELRRLTQSLSRINRELDQFAYVASHDLRAPLRGIASLANWIEDDLGPTLGPENRQHLALLRSRVHRMEALIDGILQYSRAGRVRNRVERVDLADLLRDVVDMLNVPAGTSIEISAGMPAFETERVPLQQVFLNLLENALKHSDRPDPQIRVDVRDAGDAYEFSVEDNGPGIPRQFHARIWEMFQTLQSRDKTEGAGIGLTLVKKHVETRGGRVWLESEESRGARFYFLWPKTLEQDG